MDLLGLLARKGESYLHPHGQGATRTLLDVLASHNAERIMELGCGTGATLVEARLRFPQANIVGIDQRLDMLTQARRRLAASGVAPVALVNCDISRSSFPRLFSAIYCESVFAVLSTLEWQRAAHAVFRMLEPGGIFVLNEAVWAPEVSADQARSLNQEMFKRYGLVQAVHDPLHTTDWIAAFRSVGFSMEENPRRLRPTDRELSPLAAPDREVLARSLEFSNEQARRSRRGQDLLRAIVLRWNQFATRNLGLPLDTRLFVLRKPSFQK